jgi:UDP-glucose 4-epimerase
MLKRTVLLTGGSGFIGSRVAVFLRRCHDVVTIGRTPLPGVPHIQFDLAGSEVLEIGKQLPEGAILVHAGAAMRRSPGDDAKPGRFWDLNVEGTRRLMRAFATRPPSQLVYISSVDVYALSAGPISETSLEGPETPYAASKLEAERLIQCFGSEQGVCTAILRLGSIYGPGEEAFGKLIPIAIRAALARQPVKVFGTGSAQRDVLFVDDAARAVEAAVRRKCRGIFNVVSGVPVSVLEIASLIVSLSKNPAGLQFTPSSGKQAHRTFAQSRLEEFGWSPRVSLAPGLRREIAAAREAKTLLAIDLDGTILDHWERMYRPYCEYLAAKGLKPLSPAAYKEAKRGGASEESLAARSLDPGAIRPYLIWKRQQIERWNLLCTDRLSDRTREFLLALRDRFRLVLVTARRHPRLLRRQLGSLSIHWDFEDVIVVSDGNALTGKAEALRRLQERAGHALWYIADTEQDIAAARQADVRVAAVCWGLRGAAVLRKAAPDRLIRRPWNEAGKVPSAFGR